MSARLKSAQIRWSCVKFLKESGPSTVEQLAKVSGVSLERFRVTYIPVLINTGIIKRKKIPGMGNVYFYYLREDEQKVGDLIDRAMQKRQMKARFPQPDKIIEEAFEQIKSDLLYPYTDFEVQMAKELFRAYDNVKGGVAGASIASRAWVSVYLACEACSCPIPWRYIHRITRVKGLGEVLEEFREITGTRYPIEPEHWIEGIIRRIRGLNWVTDEETLVNVEQGIDEFIKKIRTLPRLYHMASRHKALLATYLSLIQKGIKVTQEQFCKSLAITITEVSLRNWLRKFSSTTQNQKNR